ncbi:mitochondrial transcription termination factor family protein [Wolffia australiana]
MKLWRSFLGRHGRGFSSSSSPAEYQLPSVTWGAIQGRKEKLVSRVIISDYLRSLGVVADEILPLELPSSVEVMRERFEFLSKLGLSVADMNAYPLMLACSVRKNVVPVLGYLEKLGVPRSKMADFVRNYPQVLHASVIVDLAPVAKFLRGLDVDRHDLPFVLQRFPELLGFKLDGTMSTSVAFLVSVGVRPRDIGPMVTQFPFFLAMRVGNRIKPFHDLMLSIGIPRMIIARMLEKRPEMLGFDLEETVKPNLVALAAVGVRPETIPAMVAQFPQLLGLPLKAKLAAQQFFFSHKLGVGPDGFAATMERLPQLAGLNPSLISKPAEFLRGRGLSGEAVAAMVTRCPQLLVLRVEMMKRSFFFFKAEMQRPLKELVEFPEFFTYSLESRVRPRHERVKEKGIKCGLDWFLNCSDRRFEERMKAVVMEREVPGPSFVMGGKLPSPEAAAAAAAVPEDDDDDDDDDEVLYRRTLALR